MRTRFTYVALTLAVVAGLSVTVVSCSPDSTAPLRTAAASKSTVVGESSKSLQEQVAWMGKYHNDALAYALGKIKASKRISKYERCKVGLAALGEFQKAYRKAGGGPIFDDLTITRGMCEEALAAGSPFSAARFIPVDRAHLSSDISFSANNYMDQIVNQVDLSTSTLSLSFAVNKIVNQAGASLVPLEALAVAGTGSVAVSSSSYWETNESSWTSPDQLQYSRSASVSGPIEALPRAPVNISARTKAIIRADVVAAVGVLVSEWFLGEAAWGHAMIKAAAASLTAGVFYTI